MSRTFPRLPAFAFALALAMPVLPALADVVVGVRTLTLAAPERGIDLHVTVWYPARPGGVARLVGESAVFVGTPAFADAPLDGGRHPLILLSHGGGGNASRFAWMANRLVDAGYVVAGPDHPGSMSGNGVPAEAVKLWLRPSDMSAVLAGLSAEPTFAGAIDTRKVGVLGGSAGGYTALALVGARVDTARLAAFCDDGDQGMSDCAWLRRAGLDLHDVDLSPAARSNLDPRIKAAVVIDPGLVQTLTAASLARIAVPVAVLNQGRPEDVPPAVAAWKTAARIPGASFDMIPDASHFSFLSECKPDAQALLDAEGEVDPLCRDAGARPRAAIHGDLAAKIVAAFEKGL